MPRLAIRSQDARSDVTIASRGVVDALSPDFPLGDSVEVFSRREDAECFIEEVRGDDPEIAAKLRIEKRELEGGRTKRPDRLQASVRA
jgi:hypothetical protein